MAFPFDYTFLRLLAKSYLSKSGRIVKQFKKNLHNVDWARVFVKRWLGDAARTGHMFLSPVSQFSSHSISATWKKYSQISMAQLISQLLSLIWSFLNAVYTVHCCLRIVFHWTIIAKSNQCSMKLPSSGNIEHPSNKTISACIIYC